MSSDVDRLLDEHDATGVANAVRSGEVDATEVVVAAISRAQERNPALNAFVSTRFDQALDEAEAVNRARCGPRARSGVRWSSASRS